MSLALVSRFPELAPVPRIALGTFPTPIEHAAAIGPRLWIKRDDRSAEPFGGNKVRALEFLLARVLPNAPIVTVGGAGSTHALSTAVFGRRAGRRVFVGRWRQVMNDTAFVVAERLEHEADAAPVWANPAIAYAWAIARRLRGAFWIPGGGTNAFGMLGHVSAGLELADQVASGKLETPSTVVVPLGSGGTAAGIALGLHLANLPIRVVAVRVVPRIVANKPRLLSLVRRTSRLMQSLGAPPAPPLPSTAIEIVHGAYGGAYGQETEAGRRASGRFREALGVPLDATYSAKAFSVALERAQREPTLFWLTFDPRMLHA
jgi:D-cysteine desulfhydrase